MDHCRVTVLDVGQGQSVILQSEGKTFLVDCGGSDSEDAADKAAETLLSMGVSRLDGIIERIWTQTTQVALICSYPG